MVPSPLSELSLQVQTATAYLSRDYSMTSRTQLLPVLEARKQGRRAFLGRDKSLKPGGLAQTCSPVICCLGILFPHQPKCLQGEAGIAIKAT